jgi:hypothetical protein
MIGQRLAGRQVGHNWVSRFLKRQSPAVISRYLPGLDKVRVITDANKLTYQKWIERVTLANKAFR